MRKKILSVLIIFSLLISLCVNTTAAGGTDTADTANDFLRNLGTMNDVEFSPDKELTRGEFAAIMINLMRETPQSEESIGSVFSDVAKDTAHAGAIEKMTLLGYMNGISEKKFAPETAVSLMEAIKVFSDIMGFGILVANEGGYPDGYRKIAQNYGMLKNINQVYGEPLTQANMARLVYNMLSVGSIQIKSISDGNIYSYDKDKTFLSEIMKLKKISGILNDNGISGLYGDSEISTKYVRIGDTLAVVSDSVLYARNYLGYNVTAYVEDKDEDPALMYAYAGSQNETISFDVKDFISYTPETIKYDNDGKTVSKTIAKDAVMVYNGVAKKYFDKTDFDFSAGTITLISNDSSDVNVISVEKHDFMKVASVDYDKKLLNSSLIDSNRKAYQIDLDDCDYIDVTDAAGNALTFASVSAGKIIDIMYNPPKATIKISDEVIDGFTLVSSREQDGYTYVSNGGQELRYMPEYAASPYSEMMEFNSSYKIYKSGDMIIWVEKAAEALETGFLVKSYYDDTKDTGSVKIFKKDGKFAIYTLCDKVNFTDADGMELRSGADKLCDKIADYTGLVSFSLNSEEKINKFECAADTPKINGQLHKIFDRRTNQLTWTGDDGIQGSWFYEDSTVYMKIPNDLEDTKNFEIVDKKTAVDLYEKNRSRTSVAYTSKANSVVAEYVLFLEDVAGSAKIVGSDRAMIVVDKITMGMDENDENVQIIDGTVVCYEGTVKKRIKLYSTLDAIDDETGVHSAFEQVRDTLGTKDENGNLKRYDIQKGDIIRCLYSERNYVTVADLLYRPSVSNPTSSNGKKGFIVGSNGLHKEGNTNGNPFAIDTNGNQQPFSAIFAAGQTGRFIFGSVIKREGDIVQMTTMDLTDPANDPDNIGGNFAQFNVRLNGAIITADYDGDKMSSRPGELTDIKSYEEVGNECSRILMSYHWGVYIAAVIINGD